MFKPLAAIAILSAILLTGCAGSKAAPATEADTAAASAAEDEAPSDDDLKAYFDALATDIPDEMAAAIDMAAPGSNAAAYATYLAAATQAEVDGGAGSVPDEVASIDGGFSLCATDRAPGDEDCSEYTDIKYTDGKIADFKPGGNDLSTNIVLGRGKVKPIGNVGTAKMIAAYRTIAGDLMVVFEMKAKSDDFMPWMASYRSAEGRQRQVTSMSGPSDLQEGALANYAFYFEGGDLGGSVTLGDDYFGKADFKTAVR